MFSTTRRICFSALLGTALMLLPSSSLFAQDQPLPTPSDDGEDSRFRLGFVYITGGDGFFLAGKEFGNSASRIDFDNVSARAAGLELSYRLPKNWGLKLGVKNVRQEQSITYRSRTLGLIGPTTGNSVTAVRSIVHENLSVPLNITYQIPMTNPQKWGLEFGAGMALDWFGKREIYSTQLEYNVFSNDLNQVGELPNLALREEVPLSISGSAQVEATITYQQKCGGRIDFGITYSHGFQPVLEGNYYVLNPSLGNSPNRNEYAAEGEGEVVYERHRFESKGSYTGFLIRYWLPRSRFIMDRWLGNRPTK